MARGVGGRFDLTDAEWERLEPLIPIPELGRRSRHLRQQLNGIMWKYRTSSPWRDVPERYGNWDTVYGRFRTWRDDGTWQKLFDAVLADARARGSIDWKVSVDSTTNRAHQHAAGAVFTEETLDSFEASLPDRTRQKGDPARDEPPLTRTELAAALPEAMRILLARSKPTTPRRKRVVLRDGVARPGSPRPASDAPEEG
jgi:transposase